MAAGKKPNPVANVMRKEWLLTFRNLNNILFITLVPVLITVQVLVYIFLALRFAGAKLLMDTILGGAVERWLLQFTVPAGLSPEQQIEIFFFSQFPLYGLLIPCMVALSFATFSIVEEKADRNARTAPRHTCQNIRASAGKGTLRAPTGDRDELPLYRNIPSGDPHDGRR